MAKYICLNEAFIEFDQIKEMGFRKVGDKMYVKAFLLFHGIFNGNIQIVKIS